MDSHGTANSGGVFTAYSGQFMNLYPGYEFHGFRFDNGLNNKPTLFTSDAKENTLGIPTVDTPYSRVYRVTEGNRLEEWDTTLNKRGEFTMTASQFRSDDFARTALVTGEGAPSNLRNGLLCLHKRQPLVAIIQHPKDSGQDRYPNAGKAFFYELEVLSGPIQDIASGPNGEIFYAAGSDSSGNGILVAYKPDLSGTPLICPIMKNPQTVVCSDDGTHVVVIGFPINDHPTVTVVEITEKGLDPYEPKGKPFDPYEPKPVSQQFDSNNHNSNDSNWSWPSWSCLEITKTECYIMTWQPIYFDPRHPSFIRSLNLVDFRTRSWGRAPKPVDYADVAGIAVDWDGNPWSIDWDFKSIDEPVKQVVASTKGSYPTGITQSPKVFFDYHQSMYRIAWT
jgi:hypothetical protein